MQQAREFGTSAQAGIPAIPGHPRLAPLPVVPPLLTDQGAEARSRVLAHVAGLRATGHGWAAVAGLEADVESTAWVLIGAALLPALAEHRDKALDWLVRQQSHAGSWTYRSGPTIATWPTAPALLALTLADAGGEARAKATTWLVHEHSVTLSFWQRAFQRLASSWARDREPLVIQDATLDGFGWARETFAWVEPTAIAMMALAAQPRTPATTERVVMGMRFLLDRQSSDGGWNYGNKRVLSVDLPGYPDTTGWALLGLLAAVRAGAASTPTAESALARGFEALAASDPAMSSPLPAALRLLVLTARKAQAMSERTAAADRMQAAVVRALDDVRDGYATLDARTAILVLLAMHDVDLLAAPSR